MTAAPVPERAGHSRHRPDRVRRCAVALVAAGAACSAVLALVSAPLPPALNLPMVAHLSGLLAGYAVAVLLMLMARVPALERDVGADRLARWHARLGRAAIVLILVHAVAATVAWAQVQQIDLLAAALQVLSFSGLIAATLGTALLLGVAAASIRAARRRLGYERWHALHLMTYLAVGLSFAHEIAGPNLAGHPSIQIFWSLLYTVAFGLVTRYRLLDPLVRSLRHRLRVEEVRAEGLDVVSITVRGRHLDDLDAVAGQFFRWRFITLATWYQANPFSLSSAPDGQRLRLTVKAVGAGTRAIHAVRPGTRVLVAGPYGAMTHRRRRGRGVLLIAGGVGITPMRALFETIDAFGPLTLLYRATRTEELLFVDELRAIADQRGAELQVMVGRSSEPGTAMTGAELRRRVPDLAARDVYLCASPRLATAVKIAARDAGVPPQRIHHEDFAF